MWHLNIRIKEHLTCTILIVWLLCGCAHTDCDDSMSLKVNECLLNYNAFKPVDDNFFTGIDPEALRVICSTLRVSLDCIRKATNLQVEVESTQHCIDRKREGIRRIMEDLGNGSLIQVNHMCSYADIFEVYTRNQLCFYIQRDKTELCYQQFSSQSMLLHDVNFTEYCGLIDWLVDCVQERIAMNCSSEDTSGLVQALLRPSIKNIHQCRNFTRSYQQQQTNLFTLHHDIRSTTVSVRSPKSRKPKGHRTTKNPLSEKHLEPRSTTCSVFYHSIITKNIFIATLLLPVYLPLLFTSFNFAVT